MVQCDNKSAKSSPSGNCYEKSAEAKKMSFQALQKNNNATKSPSSATTTTKDNSGAWGQFKNESYFKSLHHC